MSIHFLRLHLTISEVEGELYAEGEWFRASGRNTRGATLHARGIRPIDLIDNLFWHIRISNQDYQVVIDKLVIRAAQRQLIHRLLNDALIEYRQFVKERYASFSK